MYKGCVKCSSLTNSVHNHIHGVRCRAQLALPASLSSDERSKWHQLCRTAGIYSTSKGLGQSRRVFISVTPAIAIDEAGKWAQKDQSIALRASEIHELLCEAHGGHSPYSLSELEEMLIEHADLPPDIVKLRKIKCDITCDLPESLAHWYCYCI